jgi:hypothetical protein
VAARPARRRHRHDRHRRGPVLGVGEQALRGGREHLAGAGVGVDVDARPGAHLAGRRMDPRGLDLHRRAHLDQRQEQQLGGVEAAAQIGQARGRGEAVVGDAVGRQPPQHVGAAGRVDHQLALERRRHRRAELGGARGRDVGGEVDHHRHPLPRLGVRDRGARDERGGDHGPPHGSTSSAPASR